MKITLEGKIEEPEDFMDQAKNLINRVGPKLGYDWISQVQILEGKKIAAIVYGTENGSTYGFDTVYLVWKDKSGELRHDEITNSRSSKAYLSVSDIREEGESIIVKVGNYEYKIRKDELDLA